MRAIMIMFDSLNRHMLSAYGCNRIHTPNFKRLQEKTVTFDNCYVGSMPCIPARREIHTGRYNFMHRSWGPLEPYDDSMPEILKQNYIWTHLITDHYHYWEDGGSTYHNRYSSYEFIRGQEDDMWKGDLNEINIPDHIGRATGNCRKYNWINRKYIDEETRYPIEKTFNLGIDFLKTNKNNDNWFLQVETFDPHEPFTASQQYKDLYEDKYDGPSFDWPDYVRVEETVAQVKHCINQYAALVSMCDAQLGKILDLMDKQDMWKDTMLIVNTDHGFLLSEHGWWGKCAQPFYNEVAKTPLFIWDPQCGEKDKRCDCLVQTIDLAPTLLDFFGLEVPKDMEGKSLRNTLASNSSFRKYALFGVHGGHINITDGRYVYMRGVQSGKEDLLNQYTLMPMHMRRMFTVEELKTMEFGKSFSFTKGCTLLKIKADIWDDRNPYALSGINKQSPVFTNYLFDLQSDPQQIHPIIDDNIETRMIEQMICLMNKNDAPNEIYERYGLSSI